ncbi:putative Twin-arginine translocation pathway signal [Crenothrix polyspora]|uniref:Putative Twin-arginine translocation pathway signal n=1 Tax=Crenothrix polyspora TaxID=360316 RepID=A0A1R4HIA4_9GAMM|nr:outer membrane beta-barrel protein [Crenothrix polyspora]SJM95957.1 putative Twin-arginine translocation pathway signal [Crenothrix polyspora]
MTLLKKSACPHTLGMATLLLCGAVYADERRAYVQFNAGASFAPNLSYDNFEERSETYDPGFGISAALGYRLAERFRIEGELMYQYNELKNPWHYFGSNRVGSSHYSRDSDRMRVAFLVNGYYDFKNHTAFTPFITAGIGGYHVSDYGIAFAYQAGVGVNYKYNDTFSFDLKYRYFGGEDQYDSFLLNNDWLEIGDHQVLAGIRIGF